MTYSTSTSQSHDKRTPTFREIYTDSSNLRKKDSRFFYPENILESENLSLIQRSKPQNYFISKLPGLGDYRENKRKYELKMPTLKFDNLGKTAIYNANINAALSYLNSNTAKSNYSKN